MGEPARKATGTSEVTVPPVLPDGKALPHWHSDVSAALARAAGGSVRAARTIGSSSAGPS
jgi:hypothetical protein